MSLKVCKLIALSLLFCCLNNSEANASIFNVEEFSLDNGMQVVVVPNHKAPIVKHIVMYRVGRANEPAGKGGIAHLLEHLMFRGTKHFKDGEFDRLIENNGGISNAATTYDYTYYHQFLSVSRLELAMYLEADRMQNLQIQDDIFFKERDVVYQERKQQIENNPSSPFWENLRQIIWQANPYGQPVSGKAEEIMQISKQDILDFYQRFYTPNNAVLIIAGDIEPEIAKDLANKYYGKIKSGSYNYQNNTTPMEKTTQFAGVEFSCHIPQVTIPRLYAHYKLPRYESNTTQFYAYMILSGFLDNNTTSPLYNQLVVSQKLASQVGVDFSYSSKENSEFSFYAIPNGKNNDSKIKSQFLSILKNLSSKFTLQQLNDTRQRVVANLIYANDNPSDAAEMLTVWLGARHSVRDLLELEENLNKVSVQDVRDVINELLSLSPVWGSLKPAE